MSMHTKEEIEAEIERLDETIGTASRRAEELRGKLIQIETGLNVGDIVEKQGKRYSVSGFGLYWPIGRLIKKDGSISQNTLSLYRYTLVSRNPSGTP